MAVLDKKKEFFVAVYVWQNDIQDYAYAGNLIYGSSEEDDFTTTSFKYEVDYLSQGFGAIDPANLDPKVSELFICKRPSGQLFGYFSNLLPGQFGNQLLNDIEPLWNTWNEVQKLYVLAEAQGNFGAIMINPQNDHAGPVIGSIEKLSEVVEKIRAFQQGKIRSVLTPELQGALCSLGGSKPKVDYLVSSEGRLQRYVVKLNCSGCFNDARVSSLLAESQKSARITVCPRKAQPLSCGEEVLICTNYSRKRVEGQEGKDAIIIRYNRVSFRTLLENDPVMGIGEHPKLSHMIHVIDRYSADPLADKAELFRRTLFSVGTNHTSNGLDNMEMYDTGRGRWRLSPSYNNLPSPDKGTNFQVGIESAASCTSLVKFDERWISMLGGEFGFTPLESLGFAYPVVQSLEALPIRIANSNLLEADQAVLKSVIPSEQVSKLMVKINNTPGILDEAKKRYGPQAVQKPPAPKGPENNGGPSIR